MSVRPVGIAAFAAAAAVLPVRPGAAPVVAKYRITQQNQQEADLSAVGQGKQTNVVGSTMFVTVTLADTAGGRTVHLVIDSARVDTASQMREQVKATLDSLKGAAYHAVITGGKLGAVKALRDTAGAATQMAGLFRELFPTMKAGAKAGQSWSDTTEAKNDIPAGSMTVRRVTNYKTSAGAAKGLKLETATSASFAGQQGPASIEGTGQGAGSYDLGPDGRVVSGTSQLTSSLSVASPQAPEPIPVTMKQNTTIATIK